MKTTKSKKPISLAEMRKALTAWGSGNTALLLDRVKQERARQRVLIARGVIPFDVSSPRTRNTDKLPVLMEEIGEVCQEMQNWMNPADLASNACRIRLQTELIQVAAVAVAWAESLNDFPDNNLTKDKEAV